MKLFITCFQLWKGLMTYNYRKDPVWDLEDYESIFWEYLNYSYIEPEWSEK